MTRLEACLLLNAIPNIGFFRAAKIVSHFGSAETVFENSVKEWRQVEGLGEGSCYALKQWKRYQSSVDKQIQILDTLRVKALFYGDSAYPKPLSYCPDAPIVLFYKGNLDFNQRKLISIVGTRTNTQHGKAFCEKLIEALAPYQPIICSGLAKGIDIIAHRKALEQGLETVACLAHGLERIYPPQHMETAQRLCKKGGFLTDFLPYAPFRRENFPQRNRLIAGMAHATIVVESAISGGSMNTATFAHHYGRELFAVPGRPTDLKSGGCNQLIFLQKAQLLSNPNELINALGWKKSPQYKSTQKKLFQHLSQEEVQLKEILLKKKKCLLDELAIELQWKISDTAARLIQLEMKGCIRALPGKYFEWI